MLNPQQRPLTTSAGNAFASYSPPTSAPKGGRPGRMYMTTMTALCAAGYAVANYAAQKMEQNKLQAEKEEQERLRRARLMEAYAGRDDLTHLERAMETYEVQ